MGGGARYPYPKQVWSPAGGWWVRPQAWKKNTAFVALGSAVVVWGVWSVSADREFRHIQPDRDIPSMRWAKQYQGKRDEIKATAKVSEESA